MQDYRLPLLTKSHDDKKESHRGTITQQTAKNP